MSNRCRSTGTSERATASTTHMWVVGRCDTGPSDHLVRSCRRRRWRRDSREPTGCPAGHRRLSEDKLGSRETSVGRSGGNCVGQVAQYAGDLYELSPQRASLSDDVSGSHRHRQKVSGGQHPGVHEGTKHLRGPDSPPVDTHRAMAKRDGRRGAGSRRHSHRVRKARCCAGSRTKGFVGSYRPTLVRREP